jgi:plastocyanin
MKLPFLVTIALSVAPACSQPVAGEPQQPSGTITGSVVVVDKGKVVQGSDVWVYLEDQHPKHQKQLPGRTWPASRISQRNEKFEPHTLVVPSGATVWFPNVDTQKHNVFSPTDPPGFDLETYGPDKKGRDHTFDFPDEIDIFCDIHASMSAKVKVVDSVWIAQVDDKGAFKLENVPAGSYKVVAWMPDSHETRSAKLEVQAGTTIAVSSDELHLQKSSPVARHMRKDGSPYSVYKP